MNVNPEVVDCLSKGYLKSVSWGVLNGLVSPDLGRIIGSEAENMLLDSYTSYRPQRGFRRAIEKDVLQVGSLVTVDSHFLKNGRVPERTFDKYYIAALKEVPTHMENYMKNNEWVVTNISGMLTVLVRALSADQMKFRGTTIPYDTECYFGPISTAFIRESRFYVNKTLEEHDESMIRRFGGPSLVELIKRN